MPSSNDATTSPLWNGPTALREDISRFTCEEDAAGITATRTYVGTWPEALAKAPKRGQRMEDLPNKPIIEKVTSTRPAPLVCEIVVTARIENSGGATEGKDGPAGEQPVYEVQWTQNVKSLESNELFKANIEKIVTLDPATDPTLGEREKGGKLSQPLYSKVECTMGELIQMMKTMPWTDRTVVLAAVTKSDAAVGEDVKKYFAKFSRGNDSFFVPIPVIRVTNRANEKTITTAMGKREKPPAESGFPAGYDWLCTADHCTRQGKFGKWNRVREWTGIPISTADSGWDKDLYK